MTLTHLSLFGFVCERAPGVVVVTFKFKSLGQGRLPAGRWMEREEGQVESSRFFPAGDPVPLSVLTLTDFCCLPFQGPVELIAEAFQSLNTVEADEEKETEEAPPPPPSEKEEEEEEEEDLTGLVVIRRTGRTTEECQRHVQQLFIRGEQIALVAVVPL